MTKSTRQAPQSSPFDVNKLLAALQSLLDSLPSTPVEPTALKSVQLKQLRSHIYNAIDRLQRLVQELDPVKQPPYILDPAAPEIVGRLIAETLLVQGRQPLAAVAKFYGSGVYALYYRGPFDAYQPIVNTDTPIYVGKADPASPQALTPPEQGQRLWTRLQDHQRSIVAADNLNLADFDCRFLVVRSAWQITAETYLIERFKPIWNNEVGICYGFGKHGDAPETRGNTRSPWDTLHPGRSWATKAGNVPYILSVVEIKAKIAQHFQTYPSISGSEWQA
jgi:hypothetical protein